MNSPNIVLIILDSLRADRISYRDKNKCLTPFINKLLKNSFFFENCITTSVWTVPSHISMFTGLYPSQTKLLSNNFDKLSYKIPILSEILNDLGYFTICFTENAHISKISGLARGFDILFRNWKENPSWSKSWITKKNYMTRQIFNCLRIIEMNFKRFKKLKTALEILIKKIIESLFWKDICLRNEKSIAKLEDFEKLLQNYNNEKPKYLFFNIMAAHYPYMPFNEILKHFQINLKDIKSVKNLLLNPGKYRSIINIKSNHLSVKKINILEKLYNACVYYSDSIVNKIITSLKKLDLFENSYIIITSDHGEHLGNHSDHYLWGHDTYNSVYESVIKVPLIIYNSNFKKRIIKNQVELKDLFHTILHLTKIPTKENRYLKIEKSILNQIEKKNTPKYIFGEYLKENKQKKEILSFVKKHHRDIKKSQIFKLINSIYFLRSDDYKYINYNNKINEFFNISNDSNEKSNIINNTNENYKKMKSLMRGFINKTNNPEELKELITKKEKYLLKRKIRTMKIRGI